MSRTNAQRAAALASAPPEPDWYRISDVLAKKSDTEDETTSADVFVYGTIGGGWFDDAPTAAQFVQDIAALKVDTINLYVNSPGGSVYDGISMRNALKRHPANVIATVDGIAASAASFLITAGDEVVMGENTELMIHDALTIAMGNAADFRQVATELDRVSGNIATMYADKAGGDPDDWRALMIAETWYSAQEAVDAGLADRIAASDKGDAAADAENRFDLSIFAHAGRRDAPAPAKIAAIAELRATYATPGDFLERVSALAIEHRGQKRPAEPGSTTPQNTDKKGVDPMADLREKIATRLGLQNVAEVTDEMVVAALDEALNEQVEDKKAAPIPEGTEIVDSTVLATLKTQAAEGAEARAQQISERRTTIVDGALAKGKITAESRDKWLGLLAKDEEGTVEVLDSLADGKVVNITEHGYAGDHTAGVADDDRLYDALGWAEPAKKEA